MPLHSRILLAAAMAAVTGLTAPAQEKTSATSPAGVRSVTPDTVVLSIDGHAYTAAEFERYVAAIVPPGTPLDQAVKQRVAGLLAETRLLANEAIRRGLDQDPRVLTSLAFSRDQALAHAVAYQLVQGLLAREARETYEANRAGYDQIRARHILVRTPDSPAPAPEGKPALTEDQARTLAEKIRSRLLLGEDFTQLAAAESYDTNATRGGALPPFRRMQTSPEFENAAFALKVGETSAPVKSVYGFHLIQVLERGPAPFEEVKMEIVQRLERSAFQKFLRELKQAHPATFNDTYFGPPEGFGPQEESAAVPPSYLMTRG